MKKHWKLKRVGMGMFEYEVLFIFSNDLRRVANFINKKHEWKGTLKIDSDDGDFNKKGMCVGRDGYIPVIWMPRKPKTIEEQSTLAHECLHAVGWMSKHFGLKYDDNNDEVFTHAISHLYREAMK